MGTNYVLLIGLILLLVAVDCSSSESDPKGNVNENTGLDQTVDSTVDPIKEKVDAKSVLDSTGVSEVKDNGGDQTKGSEGGIGSDAIKSKLNQQSGSNDRENLRKDGKESAEANGNTDGGKEGGNAHKGQGDSNVEDKVKTGGEREGDNVQKGQEEPNVETKGKTESEKVGNNVQKGQEESIVEVKDNKEGEREGDNVQKNQEESIFDGKGKTGVEKEGNNVQKGQKESNIEAKGKPDGQREGDNVQKDQEESKIEAKGKPDGEREGDNVQKGQEGSNIEAKRKPDAEREGDIVHKGQEGSNVEAEGKKDVEKEGNSVLKGQEESNLEDQGKTKNEKNKNPDDNVDPKKVTKEKDDIHDSVQPPPPPAPTRSDGFRSEECDPSNMCMDKKKRFVACLRVPGNESPDLSLLIQNKGKVPLTLKISAPAFVQLEETDIELLEKEDKKVKVSIITSGTENLIVLKDGSGECSLDFKDLIVHNSAKSYVNYLSQTPTTTFIFVVAILTLASGWMCMSFRRRQLKRSGLKYQRVDMNLPVSVAVGAKTEPDVNDGWNNSWGDDWGDEEAPMTPSKPVTPSVSAKGLASRRLSKEGWKD